MFIHEQVEEVNQALDIEWKEHVRRTKGRRGGIQPSSARESLYKALLTNHRILEGQKASLEKLTEQIKELKVKNITSPWHTVRRLPFWIKVVIINKSELTSIYVPSICIFSPSLFPPPSDEAVPMPPPRNRPK